MSDLAVTNTFVALTTAVASQVNQNYSDIVNYINNRDDGTATWDNMNVTATVGNPVTIKSNQSTTEVAIDNTATDGDPILTWKLSGSTIITAGPDDSDSDTFKIGTTGLTTNIALQIPSTGSQIQCNAGSAATPGLAFIAAGSSGMYSPTSTTCSVTANGTETARFSSTNIEIRGSVVIFNTNGSAANPSYSFSARQTDGIYSSGVNQISVGLNSAQTYAFTTTNFRPVGAGVISTGDATDYWNDISYKTLTDRGCLPWCDDGVELVDGRIVSDLEAICNIQKHPTKRTVQDLPMLDYSTFPKKAYKKETVGDDGVEMTMMFGVILGAFKEVSKRIEALEKK